MRLPPATWRLAIKLKLWSVLKKYCRWSRRPKIVSGKAWFLATQVLLTLRLAKKKRLLNFSVSGLPMNVKERTRVARLKLLEVWARLMKLLVIKGKPLIFTGRRYRFTIKEVEQLTMSISR